MTESFQLYLPKSKREVEIDISLPKVKDNIIFDTLYFLDGQNSFSDEKASFGRSIRATKVLNKTAKYLNKRILGVAIHNSKSDLGRVNEYTPFYLENPESKYQTHDIKNCHNFCDDLVNTIIPFIESKYNTYKSAEHRFIYGSSLAATTALYIAFKYKDSFDYIGSFSTASFLFEAEFTKFLIDKVFKNPVVWVLAITDLFVYVVRFAILDWGPSMLQEMGLSQALSGWTVAIFEVAGCLGMIAAGYISDKFFKSRSQRVCVIEMALVAICLVALHYIQDMNTPVLFLFVLALAGFFLYGPQALLGVVASNEVSKKAASSAVGIIGFMSYFSTLITGYPLGKFADTYGWHPIFILMAVIAVIGTLIIATTWNLKPKSVVKDDENQ